MKYFIQIVFFCLVAFSAAAQDDEDLPQQEPKVREKIEAARIAYITDQLALTPEEAEKFWPIYRAMAHAFVSFASAFTASSIALRVFFAMRSMKRMPFR